MSAHWIWWAIYVVLGLGWLISKLGENRKQAEHAARLKAVFKPMGIRVDECDESWFRRKFLTRHWDITGPPVGYGDPDPAWGRLNRSYVRMVPLLDGYCQAAKDANERAELRAAFAAWAKEKLR